MNPKYRSKKAILAVSVLVCVIALFLIALFALHFPGQKEETIVLPAPNTTPSTQEPEEVPEQESAFLEVDNRNVLAVLQTLSRPTSYRQRYTVTVGTDESQNVRQVDIWVNRSLLQAEITDSARTRVLISDGKTAYLWYKGIGDVICVSLDEALKEEDLLGIPDFDAFLNVEDSMVEEADYLVLEDPQVQCIFLCTQENAASVRYWINLENGLLYQSDILEHNKQIYTVRQTEYVFLAAEDESFYERFLLPDGSDPFTAAEETQQP